ncbi:uncharacterized protein C8A04DRAFT_8961 [Dichotomopilus funicola]|uniref:Uncharacterized protein n=1 Tax=Dichotomopilus funicola TaxID=1934379 RepID=A0AAN6V9I0_9PEZI|nr:hypothetical protein C8A04DRAFT_8961 [Dichotomopilus funicola]
MPRSMAPKHAIALDGLHFGPGRVFSSRAVAERMYGLLLGNEYFDTPTGPGKDIEQVRERVAGILSAIFGICVTRVPIFFSLNDPALAWQVVAGDVAEQRGCTIPAAEVCELVTVFSDARRTFFECPGDGTVAAARVASSLTTIIDQWLEATTAAVPASEHQPTTLASRPAVAESPALERLFANFTFADATPSGREAAHAHAHAHAHDNDAWPPSYLAPADIAHLNHPHLRELLEGVCWNDKGTVPTLPTERANPLCLRLFLGWLAAAYTPPPSATTPGSSSSSNSSSSNNNNNDTTIPTIPTITTTTTATVTESRALYTAPIAFFVNKDRQAWYEDSGRQSKKFGHLDGFLAYAAEAFSKRGKSSVLAARNIFNNHANMRRFGTAVMLRVVSRAGVPGLQVAFFCPWDRHDWTQKSWRLYEWRLRLWKESLVRKIEAWAQECDVPLHEGYMGESWIVRKDRDHDSVEMCAGWLWRAMRALEQTVPGGDEDNTWEWEESCRFKRMEDWGVGAVSEDGEGDEDPMDVDMDE